MSQPNIAEPEPIAQELTRPDRATSNANAHLEAVPSWLIGPRLWIVGAAIGTVAIAIRVWQVGSIGLNSDEAVYSGQAASIAGDPELGQYFPIFRAHPLLFHSLVSVFYRVFGVDDLIPRLVGVAFGVATVYLVYRLGKLLFGTQVGIVAALFLAVVPYHVLVTRQALLDGPMMFFATLSLYLLARYALRPRTSSMVAIGAALGLAFLAKETAILFVPAAYAFFALTPAIRVSWRRVLGASVVYILVVAPFGIAVAAGGATSTGQNFLVWQLFRSANHSWAFYPAQIAWAIGPLLLGAAGVALWRARDTWGWKQTLMLTWVVVPLAFFQLWPVKGFQYPLPIVAPIAVLAAQLLVGERHPRKLGAQPASKAAAPRWFEHPAARPAAIGIIVLSLVAVSLVRIAGPSTVPLLAGTGGVPGGRETGAWIQEHAPVGARFMTIGPSMANLVQFYGNRHALGLSVSPNPLHRNPVYEPIENPDFSIRDGRIQYLVWDAYSASRSKFFSDRLLQYVDRYHGRVVHTETVAGTGADGEPVETPGIVVYEVRP